MSTTECCGWTGWAEMAGIGPDGRRLAGPVAHDAPTAPPTSTPETASFGAVYALMRRLSRGTSMPVWRAAARERAVGAP